MLHHLSRMQVDQRTKGLQFEKVKIGEDLKIAAEIWIAGARDNGGTFHKEITLAEISSPTGGVVNATHLLFESALGMGQMPQLNVARAHHPARVGKIGKGPDAERSHRQVVVLIHGNAGTKRQDRAPTR